MELGMIGLGRMGSNMTERLMQAGHKVVVFDRSPDIVRRMAGRGASGSDSIASLVRQMTPPRLVWIMAPVEAVEQTIEGLALALNAGDVIIDGGNSNYKESMRRAAALTNRSIRFLDVGTSGGIHGLEGGYCLMIGGETSAVQHARPVFEALAPSADRGWAHVGPSGAGHFVKMVHNGIEYGLMQAYAEGFSLLKNKIDLDLNLPQIAELWRHESVIRSWLLDLTAEALAGNPRLDGVRPYVADSGEGRWTVAEAIEQGVPAPIITLSLLERLHSREPESFANKLLSVMRNKFGGHEVKKP